MRVGESLSLATMELARAGVPQARLDARVLLAHALGGPLERLLSAPEVTLPAMAEDLYRRLVARRLKREPVSRIIGRREFWSLDFALSPATLDPRPDSESVVEAALDWSRDKGKIEVLDLGAGSGCLLLAFLSERPETSGLGIDVAADAVAVATQNALALGLVQRARFQVGDWGAGLAGSYDLILCNPPYVAEGQIDGLEPEVARHEPRLALAGGADGLDAYRRLGPDLARLLGPTGAAMVEIGQDQAQPVEAILQVYGLRAAERRRDLAGIERCLVLVHSGNSR